MVDDYIEKKSKRAFTNPANPNDAFTEKAEVRQIPFEELEEYNSYKGEDHAIENFTMNALHEMVTFIYELRNESDDPSGSLDFLEYDNIDEIYITQKPFEPTVVIVEFHETPEWFSMPNAEFREFYWHPHPAHSGEWTGAYFQPR